MISGRIAMVPLMTRRGVKHSIHRNYSFCFQNKIVNNNLINLHKSNDVAGMTGLLSAGIVALSAILALKSEVFSDEVPSRHNLFDKGIFSSCIREDQIETNMEECKARGKPWSTYHTTTNFPSMILYPENTEVETLKMILALTRNLNFDLLYFRTLAEYYGGDNVFFKSLF